MKILIYGGDVVGSIYAAHLHGPKHDITILASANRLAQLQQHGVVLRHGITGDDIYLHVPVIDRLTVNDHYDVALVTVPSYELSRLPPELTCNKQISTLLIMASHFGACEHWHNTLNISRVLGGAGIMNGTKVEYLPTPLLLQRATVGTLDDHAVPHVRRAVHMFRQAGLYVSTCGRMDALLKTQAAVFVSLAAGLRLAQNSGMRPGYDLNTAKLVIQSVRECFAVLGELQQVTPRYLKWISSAPSKYLANLLLQWSRTTEFDLTVAAQLNAAGAELAYLAEQLRLFSMLASIETPAFDELTACLTIEREDELHAHVHMCAS